MKKKFDGVLFDLDGTLWDASSVTAQTWVEVLARHPDVKAAVELNRDSEIGRAHV